MNLFHSLYSTFDDGKKLYLLTFAGFVAETDATIKPQNRWNSTCSVIEHCSTVWPTPHNVTIMVTLCNITFRTFGPRLSVGTRIVFLFNVGLFTAVWFTSVSSSLLSVSLFYFNYSQNENRVPRKLVQNYPSCMDLGKSRAICFTTPSRNCHGNYYRSASSVIENLRDENAVDGLHTIYVSILYNLA